MDTSHKKIKRPGSVRLNPKQYEEMKRLGFDSESTYLKFKLEAASKQLLESKPEPLEHSGGSLEQSLALQRLEIENKQLQSKLQELLVNKEQALSGVHSRVEHLLKEQLQERDFQQLKKEFRTLEKEVDTQKALVEKSKKEAADKDDEIKALVKKLSFVELGKVLLPGAISGLAKQFPQQMQGLASTLGALTDDTAQLPIADAGQKELLQIMDYLQGLYGAEHFETFLELAVAIGEGMKSQPKLLSKIQYYLQKLVASKEEETAST